MKSLRRETVPIKNSSDVVAARQRVRQWAQELKFTLVDQTKLVTAASELGRNTLDHGKGGQMIMDIVEDLTKTGLRLTFEDQGPGIPDVSVALRDGYSTGSGMGLGLGGSRRLVNEFDIHSEPGKGTRVSVIRWK